MTSNQQKYLTQRLYKFLQEGHYIMFKKMIYNRGTIEPHIYPTIVELDYRDKVLPTLLHEFLHYQYPTWSETRILQAESSWVESLTDRQIRNIFKRFALSL